LIDKLSEELEGRSWSRWQARIRGRPHGLEGQDGPRRRNLYESEGKWAPSLTLARL